MKIINLFSLFQNSYNEAGWQVWRGRTLCAVFHTRAAARAYMSARA